jgi:hypothetical protein
LDLDEDFDEGREKDSFSFIVTSCANANQQKKGEMEKKNKTASFRYEARVWFNF